MATLSLASIQFQTTFKAIVKSQIDGLVDASVQLGVQKSPATTLTSGTGANQANRFVQDTGRSLTSGTNETINLYSYGSIDMGAGAGNGPLGTALAITTLVGLLIAVQPSSAGTLTLGGEGTANAWTAMFGTNAHTIGSFAAGSWFEIFNPTTTAWVVGSANNNLLKIAAVGGNVLYDIYVIGRQ